jgi:hypothetical protein
MPTDDGILAEFLPQQDRQDDALDTSGWLPGHGPSRPATRHSATILRLPRRSSH